MVLWIVPLSWSGGESDFRRQRHLSSLVGHSRVLVTIVISAGRTGSLLGIIAVHHVHIRWVDHFFIAIGSVSGVVMRPGTKVKVSAWESLRSIAANWARV